MPNKYFKTLGWHNDTFIKIITFHSASQQRDLLFKYATWNTLLKHNLER